MVMARVAGLALKDHGLKGLTQRLTFQGLSSAMTF